jgi:hypothetical protein
MRQKQLQHGVDLKQQATEQRSQREMERRLGTSPAGAPAGGYRTIDNQSHRGGGDGGHWTASVMAPFGNDGNIAGAKADEVVEQLTTKGRGAFSPRVTTPHQLPGLGPMREAVAVDNVAGVQTTRYNQQQVEHRRRHIPEDRRPEPDSSPRERHPLSTEQDRRSENETRLMDVYGNVILSKALSPQVRARAESGQDEVAQQVATAPAQLSDKEIMAMWTQKRSARDVQWSAGLEDVQQSVSEIGDIFANVADLPTPEAPTPLIPAAPEQGTSVGGSEGSKADVGALRMMVDQLAAEAMQAEQQAKRQPDRGGGAQRTKQQFLSGSDVFAPSRSDTHDDDRFVSHSQQTMRDAKAQQEAAGSGVVGTNLSKTDFLKGSDVFAPLRSDTHDGDRFISHSQQTMRDAKAQQEAARSGVAGTNLSKTDFLKGSDVFAPLRSDTHDGDRFISHSQQTMRDIDANRNAGQKAIEVNEALANARRALAEAERSQ